MEANIRIEARVVSVQSLFGSDTSFRIPPFQRPYSWDKKRQWGPLWEDIEGLAKRMLSETTAARPHFMGAIVMQQRTTPVDVATTRLVIDGQQRLTTLQLAIRAAADVLKVRGMEDRADRLKTLTMNRTAYTGGNDDNLAKIRQTNESDRKAFQAIMLDETVEPDISSSIGKCYRYFHRATEKYLEGPLLSPTQEAKDLAEALEVALSRLLVVVAIELAEQDEPYTIFATLNDRGLHLGPADIVKNMMMQLADVGDDENKAEQVWGLFEHDPWWRKATGENNLTRTQADRFIDHWVSISSGRDPRSSERLPSAVAKYLNDVGRENTWVAVNDLNQKAPTYRRIHESNLTGAEDFLKRMKALGVGAPMATMLWLYTTDVLPVERRFITDAVESYVVRRSLAGMTTNALRDTFAELITEIAQLGTESPIDTVIKHLAKGSPVNRRWPADQEVKQFLSNQPMKGTTSAQREIFAAIEQHLRPPTAEPIGPTEKLTIDHILPKSWQDNWPLPKGTQNREAAELARNRTVKFIGNLTIITKSLNSTIRNKPWNEKRQLLKDSTLYMNRKLIDDAPNSWDEEAIKQRSIFMAELTTEIWKSPTDYVAQARAFAV